MPLVFRRRTKSSFALERRGRVVRAIFAENEENETKVSLVTVIDVECDRHPCLGRVR